MPAACEKELRLFCRMLAKLNVQTLRLGPDDEPETDLGLRREAGLPPLSLPAPRERTILVMDDPFACRYAAVPLPGAEETLLIGPYLTAEPGDETIAPLLQRLHLPPRLLPTLRRYYCSLSLLRDEGVMEALLAALGETLYGAGDAFSIVRADLAAPAAPPAEPPAAQAVAPLDARLLEQRYAQERRLLRAVSEGLTQEAERLIAPAGLAVMERRAADPLRNVKNYAVILNTLLRKAAEEGGVHPLHIDDQSRRFAFRIENLRAVSEAPRLLRAMVAGYCQLVNAHATAYHSALVRDAILHVDADLTADLRLHALAGRLNVSPGYLSLLFRRETGSTLTDYVARRRMDRASFLLAFTDMQVQAVGTHCGIPDANYFCKTFKRYTGKTPRDFRAQARRS